MTALARSDDGKQQSRATMNLYLSAVVVAQRTAGYPLDRKHPVIAETWRGIAIDLR